MLGNIICKNTLVRIKTILQNLLFEVTTLNNNDRLLNEKIIIKIISIEEL